eukprot:TRINITY_DN63982_c0_g1_i1.p1 TRINITY_DN63982_c0_g1~~TRINITY_DN63982_c0_g1_i1.p1  ORF type:complete len:421 (-),score=30.17 TRINITY_DN63982_c0_g1_i1:100-1362(-)
MGACGARGKPNVPVVADIAARPACDAYSTIEPRKILPSIWKHFVFHSVALWFGLPILVLLQALVAALRPICASGWNLFPLIGVVLVIAHHFYAETTTWAHVNSLITDPERTVVRQRGIFRNRRQLMLLAAFLDVGVYVNFMFPVWAASCGDAISESWVHSWTLVPVVGELLAGFLHSLGFSGMLLFTMLLRWLPETIILVCMIVFNPVSHVSDDERRVSGGKFAEWVLFADTSQMLSVSRFLKEISAQRKWVFEGERDARSANSGEAFAAEREQGQFLVQIGREDKSHLVKTSLHVEAHRINTEQNVYMVAMSKLLLRTLFGCITQLWVQTAFLMHSFTLLDMEGRVKVSVSIALCTVDLMAGVGKMPGSRESIGCVGLLLCALSVFFAAWCVARVYHAFICPEHVWNLTSGCVSADYGV